jgi:hypothetical protein
MFGDPFDSSLQLAASSRGKVKLISAKGGSAPFQGPSKFTSLTMPMIFESRQPCSLLEGVTGVDEKKCQRNPPFAAKPVDSFHDAHQRILSYVSIAPLI